MKKYLLGVIGFVLMCGFMTRVAHAESGFSVQVTPSPIIATLKPGTEQTQELKVLNTSSEQDTFRVDLRSFSVDNLTGEVKLGNDAPSDVASMVTFEQSEFTLAPQQWFTARMHISTPKDAGFSYSFAVVVSRNENGATQGTAQIKGSVAVFALLNVDRPDATRKVDLVSFVSPKKIYEYVPTEFAVTFKNSGNTLVQPSGNVFIDRTNSGQGSLGVLQVNEAKGYIIPGSERTLKTSWTNGFPTTETKDGVTKTIWDWSKLNQLRFGKYTAKLVAVYDDGERDVPLEAELSFWVIPWKLILGALAVLAILLLGLWTAFKKPILLVLKKGSHEKSKAD